MSNGTGSRRALTLAALLFAPIALTACGGGGGGSKGEPAFYTDPPPLKVIRIDASRRENWERNRSLTITFSAPLSKKSLQRGVIEKAIQIGIVTANGRIAAKGRFCFGKHPVSGADDRTVLIFDPTRTTTDSDGGCGTIECSDNPLGFNSFTSYEVRIPDLSTSKKVLTSTNGKPIIEPFDTFFNTGEDYVKEIEQPKYVGIDGDGALGFDPPRFVSGEVPYNARIFLHFDEPMDPTSFDTTSIQVRNDTLSTLQGQNVLVPGTFTSDACGQTWRFNPAFSYGGAGYDISVILTSAVRDLSLNPLSNPQTIRFRTEVRAGIPTVQTITENFDTTIRRDAPNTTAEWGTVTPGVLEGGAVTTDVVTVALQTAQFPGGVRTRVRDHPFAKSGSAGVGHDQWIYTQADIGTPGAITQVEWGPSSNALFASDHPKTRVTLGHTQSDALSTNMANNFDVGTPVKVADAFYTIPQRATIDPPCGTDACAVGYWPLPAFTNFFEYNGKNNLILDVDAQPGTNYQITRIFFGPVGFPNRHAFGAFDTANTTSPPEPVVTDARFTKKRRTTIATSLFYDTGQNNPNFSTPILSPVSQSGGTSMQAEYEGADGILFPIPGNPNNVVPDPTTFSGWVTNIDQLDGLRFVRFRMTFIANVNTGQVPFISELSVPYIF
jgi:hypothetical protein